MVNNQNQRERLERVEKNIKMSSIADSNTIEYNKLLTDLYYWMEDRRYRQLPVAPLHEFLWHERWAVNQKKEIFSKTQQQLFVLTPKNAAETLARAFPEIPLAEVKPIITRLVELIRVFATARKATGDEGIYSRYQERIGRETVALDRWADFFIFDDNLFHHQNGLIHGKNYRKRLWWKKQTEPTPRELQAIVRLIKKCKTVATEEKRISTTSGIINEAMRYLGNRGYKPIQALCRKLPDETSTTKMRTTITVPGKVYSSQQSVDFAMVLKELAKFQNKAPGGIRAQIADMADGEPEVVDKLAEIMACCCLSIPVKPKLWIIATNEKNYVINLLDMLFFLENEQSSLSKRVKPQTIFTERILTALIECTYLGAQLVCLESASNLAVLNEEYFLQLKKIVSRKPVTLSLSGAGKLTYHNRCQWVAFLNGEAEVRRYKEFLGDLAEVIYLPNLNAPATEWKLDFDSELWLLTVFAIYGMTRMLEKRKAKDLYDPSALIQSFLKESCVLGENEICYNDELYEAYSNFLRTRYSMKPLPKGRFHNLFSAMTNIECSRPRTCRSDYKRGYRGISVKMERAAADSSEIRKEKIGAYLDAIHKKVVKLLGIDGVSDAEKQFN